MDNNNNKSGYGLIGKASDSSLEKWQKNLYYASIPFRTQGMASIINKSLGSKSHEINNKPWLQDMASRSFGVLVAAIASTIRTAWLIAPLAAVALDMGATAIISSFLAGAAVAGGGYVARITHDDIAKERDYRDGKRKNITNNFIKKEPLLQSGDIKSDIDLQRKTLTKDSNLATDYRSMVNDERSLSDKNILDR